MTHSEDDADLRQQFSWLETRLKSLEKTLYDVTVYLQNQAKASPEKNKPSEPASEKSTLRPITLAEPRTDIPTQKKERWIAIENEQPSDLPQEPPKTSIVSQPVSSTKTSKSFEFPDYMKKSEFWLNKVGIGMIIFAVIFAFKYSIDQGWLTPAVRIGFGLFLGLVQSGFSHNIYKKRRHFSLVLLGGGIATFYICGFAAFQIFNLVSHPVAFGFMGVVTLFAYSISLRQNESILSIIGTAGGLGTPFMLYTAQGNIPGLMLYTCLLIAGSCAIYFFKGWRSVLALTVIGGWVVFLIAQLKGLPYAHSEASPDRWAIQYGLIFVWLAYWFIPLLRESLAQLKPDKWAYPPLLMGGKPISPDLGKAVHHYVHLLTVSTPLIALGLSKDLWTFSNTTWGWVTMAMAVIYGVVTWNLVRLKIRSSLSYTNGLIGLLFFTISISLFLEGSTLLVALGTEALVLFLIARKQENRVIEITSHILFSIVAFSVLGRITYFSAGDIPLLNARALSDLWFVGGVLAVSILTRKIAVTRVYFIGAVALLTGLLCREFDGNAHVIALTTEAILIHLFVRFKRDTVLTAVSHGYTALIALWALARMIQFDISGMPIFNMQAGTDLILIAFVLILPFFLKKSWEKQAYMVAGFILIAFLLNREFDGNVRFFAISLNAVVFQYLAYRLKYSKVLQIGNVYFGILGAWLLYRIGIYDTSGLIRFSSITTSESLAVFNWQAMTDLFLIVSGVGIAKYVYKNLKTEQIFYLAVSHVAVLLWMLREFSSLANGQGFVSVAWCVYAVTLLIIGLRYNQHKIRIAALLTLLIVIAKLFLVDLSRIEAIYRVLIFLGIGGVLMLLSYYFKALWRNDDETDENKSESEAN
ncbi:MAG: DUF2339 domain-containing protein [candidate division Zixibacteria bacterium]|nr:DUF2339 domain-containing protein [candidate division Zixibacteria bacterium]